MTPDQDCFRRAAKRFVKGLEVEREEQERAAAGQVSEDENKDKAGAVIELEPDGLSVDVPEGVDLLEPAGLDEDVTEEVGLLGFDGSGEVVGEKTGPERAMVTIKVDGVDCEVEVLRYPNGSMKDAATGRWLAPPSPNTFSDPQKAKDAVTTRHERVLELAREGLVRGANRSGEHQVATPAEAWAAIVEEQTVLAMGDKRGSTASARLVGSATKMISEDKPQTVDVRVRAAVAVVSLDAILMGMFNRLHPTDPRRALDEMRKYKAELR